MGGRARSKCSPTPLRRPHRYTRMYGADAGFRRSTPRRQFETSRCSERPELIRASLSRAGICWRTATGGFTPWRSRSNAPITRVYTAISTTRCRPAQSNSACWQIAGCGTVGDHGTRGEFLTRRTPPSRPSTATIPLAQYAAATIGSPPWPGPDKPVITTNYVAGQYPPRPLHQEPRTT